MTSAELDLEAGARRWQERGLPRPDILVVSGSGLAVELTMEASRSLPLQDILPFEVRPIEGHPHELQTFTDPTGRQVTYQRGRLHGYQGYSPAEVVFSIRLAAHLGARLLMMTNAAGGLDPEQRAGDLVLIKDHINLTGNNPLYGEMPTDWGPRFPDMTDAYPAPLRERARDEAGRVGLELAEGVYAGLQGPSYETAAEVRMLRTLGADLVGMSTVHEVIAARHMGLRCLCISLVANLAAGVAPTVLTHEEVLAAGRDAAAHVGDVLRGLLARDDLAT
jgi:purine-nucleoside phosphorylase